MRGELDIARINADFEFEKIQGRATAWVAFDKGTSREFPIKLSTYKKMWEAYRYFVLVDPNKGPLRKRTFSVQLHFKRELEEDILRREALADLKANPPIMIPPVGGVPIPARLPKPTPSPEPIKLLDINDADLKQISDVNFTGAHKTCATKTGTTKVIYQLKNLCQPSLSRNFLILAKLGFFDGKNISSYFGSVALGYFGSEGMTEPMYLPPDKWYTPANAVIDDKKYKPDPTSSSRSLSATEYGKTWQKIKSVTPLGGLVSIVENKPGLAETRQALITKIGISGFTNLQEGQDALSQRNAFPIIFAELVRPVASRRQANDQGNMMNDFFKNMVQESLGNGPDQKKYRFTLECVDILPPQIEEWGSANQETLESC